MSAHDPGIRGIHHVAIICRDYERSKRFYTEALGLTIIAENHRADRNSTKLDLAIPCGGMLELFSFPDPPPRPTQPEAVGLRHLAFRVDNLDGAIATFQSRGIPFEPVRTDPYTNRRHTFFRDPDDLPLELYEDGPCE
ncbi:MAG: VOC family protein [Phycisphaerales bacterium]|nr:MAG: VOC family protein [Phycisphaerales bacterium]